MLDHDNLFRAVCSGVVSHLSFLRFRSLFSQAFLSSLNVFSRVPSLLKYPAWFQTNSAALWVPKSMIRTNVASFGMAASFGFCVLYLYS